MQFFFNSLAAVFKIKASNKYKKKRSWVADRYEKHFYIDAWV